MLREMEKLRLTVADLEKELNEIGSLDDESRSLLEQAASDIQHALHKNDRVALAQQPLSERLRDATSTFEASHPNLAGIVQKVIDALGQLGI